MFFAFLKCRERGGGLVCVVRGDADVRVQADTNQTMVVCLVICAGTVAVDGEG